MASEEPDVRDPGQEAHRGAAESQAGIHSRDPAVSSPQGRAGKREADERAKLAAEEPDAHGVERLRFADRFGTRQMPLPRSLAHLKREVSEK
jgi:hypothetical protein